VSVTATDRVVVGPIRRHRSEQLDALALRQRPDGSEFLFPVSVIDVQNIDDRMRAAGAHEFPERLGYDLHERIRSRESVPLWLYVFAGLEYLTAQRSQRGSEIIPIRHHIIPARRAHANLPHPPDRFWPATRTPERRR
jgi:hypothetical protein